MEEEALEFGSERVAAAWLVSHWARSGLLSWPSRSPCLRRERARCLKDQLCQLQLARLPLLEPQVQQVPQAVQVLLEWELLLGLAHEQAFEDVGTHAPLIRPSRVQARSSKCIAYPVP